MTRRKSVEAEGGNKVRRYATYDRNTLSDLIAIFAANLEMAYKTSGVTDYTAKDCVDRAAEIVLREYVRDMDLNQVTFHLDTT